MTSFCADRPPRQIVLPPIPFWIPVKSISRRFSPAEFEELYYEEQMRAAIETRLN